MPSDANILKQNAALSQQVAVLKRTAVLAQDRLDNTCKQLQEERARTLLAQQRLTDQCVQFDAARQQLDEARQHHQDVSARVDVELTNQNVLIRALREELSLLRHKLFGSSSEAAPVEQAWLFNEAELHAAPIPDVNEADDVDEAAAPRRYRGRPKIPAHFQRVEVHHELPESERTCPHDGTALVEIGCDTSEQFEYIPATARVLKHFRHKYACPHCASHVAIAARPAEPIPKSIASAGLLGYVAGAKYVDGLPLYRLAVILSRLGIEINRTTLASWMIAMGELVQPLMDRLWKEVRSGCLLHMDETRVQVLNEPGRAPQTMSFMWVVATGPPDRSTVLFHYAPSRGKAVAIELLDGFSGALMVDGYDGYEGIANVTRLGCMAHARRKFVEAQKVQPKGIPGKADAALKMIKTLYKIERDAAGLTPSERKALRDEQAQPVIDQLRRWLTIEKPREPPKTALGKAMTYLKNQWPYLVGYLQDGSYPIDNNRVENAIRPFVVGRKGWLFSASVAGAKASANLYSLVETAKGHGLDPVAYLTRVFTELPRATTQEHIDALLPARVAEQLAAEALPN